MRSPSTLACLQFFVVLSCNAPCVVGAQGPGTSGAPAQQQTPAAKRPGAPGAPAQRPAWQRWQRPAVPQTAPAGPAEPAGYRALVEGAKSEYDGGNFVEARALFHKANTLFPNARALRGIGMTEFELRNYGDSVASLDEALKSAVRPLEGTLRTETEQLLERAKSFIARLSLAVEPPGATILVDGMPAQPGPQGNIVLTAGSHVLEFRAEGYATEKRAIKVMGGEEETLRVVLPRNAPASVAPTMAAAPMPVAPMPVSEPQPAPRKRLYKNPWLWTGVGVIAAGAAAGLAFGLSRDGGGTSQPIDGTGIWTSAKLP